MKKALLAGVFMLTLGMAAVCASAEEAVTETVEEVVTEAVEETAVPLVETEMLDYIGAWYYVRYEGNMITPNDFNLFVFPDGSLVLDGQKTGFDVEEDGVLSVDLSDFEGSDGYTLTAQSVPYSQEIVERFGFEEGRWESMLVYGGNVLILTFTYPDPKNPLASEDAVTNVCFLRTRHQDVFLKSWMSAKSWWVGDHLLAIDEAGNMDLDDGASTGKAIFSYDYNLGYPMTVRFSWDGGGYFTYYPSKITEDTIELVNIEKPDEVLLLEYSGTLEPEVEEMSEEAMTE